MPEEENKQNLAEADIESIQQKDDEAAIAQLMDETPEETGEIINDPNPPEPKPVERGATPPPAPEPQPEEKPPVEAPAKSETPPAAVPQAKSDEELEADLNTIQPQKGAHPNIVKGIDAMKARVREANTALRQAQEKIAESDKVTKELSEKQGKLPEDVERELTELRNFRRAKDIESDPVFQQKYNAPIQQLETETLGLMKTWGLPDELEKFISDNGGATAVRYSQELMPNGKETKASWFKREIWDNLNDAQKEDLDDNIRSVRQLKKAQDREIQAAKSDAQKWEAARAEQQEKQAKDWHAKATEIRDQMVKKLGVMGVEWEPKPEATPEEKEIARVHNERLKRSVGLYAQMVGNMDPEVEIPKAFAAAQAMYLSELVQDKDKELTELRKAHDELKEKYDKIHKSGRTAKDSNSPPITSKTEPTTPLWKVSDSKAINDAFKDLQ
jgi:hypothetical protein